MIDFTNCKMIPGRAYNGANGSKIAVSFHDAVYMLKVPPSGRGKPTELSYTNSCISEHLASTIFNLIGIEAQETMLGTFRVGEQTKTVCACKDFTADGKRLFDFCSIKNTIIDSDTGGNGTELEDIMDTIDRQQFVSARILREHFWNMFIADALLGNFDRHNGNWGFLYDDKIAEAQIAPIFDCGSCLLPQANEKIMEKLLTDENELHARIFQFPASAIKRSGRKINYYDFLTQKQRADCSAALERIVPQIDLTQIDSFIDAVEGISDLQKAFYKRYIAARYELLLQPALELARTARS